MTEEVFITSTTLENCNADGYQFLLTNLGNNTALNPVLSSTNQIELQHIAGIRYNTSYSVKIRIVVDGSPQGFYGPSHSFETENYPLIHLAGEFDVSDAGSLGYQQFIHADKYPIFHSGFTWKFTSTVNPDESFTYGTGELLYLSEIDLNDTE